MYVSSNLLCKFLSACVDKVDVYLVPLKVSLVIGEVGADVVGSLCLHIQSGIHASFRLRGTTSHPSLAYLVISIHVISFGTRFGLSYPVAIANVQAFRLLQLGVGAIEILQSIGTGIHEVECIDEAGNGVLITHIIIPRCSAGIDIAFLFRIVVHIAWNPRHLMLSKTRVVVRTLDHQHIGRLGLVVAKGRLICLTRTESTQSDEYRFAVVLGLLEHKEWILIYSYTAVLKTLDAGNLVPAYHLLVEVVVEFRGTHLVRLRRRSPVALIHQFLGEGQSVCILIALSVVHHVLVHPLGILTLEVALYVPSPVLL